MAFTLFETFVGDEAAPGNDGLWSMDCSAVLRVKTIHISSPILAAKSPFFYKVMVFTVMYAVFGPWIPLFINLFHASCSCFQMEWESQSSDK